MPLARAVEALDRLEDGRLGLGPGLERGPWKQLVLERREVALAHRIVVRVAQPLGWTKRSVASTAAAPIMDITRSGVSA